MSPDDQVQIEARNAGDRAAEKTTRAGMIGFFVLAFAVLIGVLLVSGIV